MAKRTFLALLGLLLLSGVSHGADSTKVADVEPVAKDVRMVDFSPRLIDKDFKFRYPGNWYVREEFILTHHGAIFTRDKIEENKQPAVAVFVYRDQGVFKPRGSAPAETWEGFKQKWGESAKSGTGLKIMSFQETAIGNMPAYRMDAEDTGNAVTMINIKSGDDLYTVTAVCRKDLFPLYRGLLEDMMTSLEIPAGKNKWVGVKELSKAEFSDPRAVIEVSRGKAVVITMRSNPTTGYSWVVARPVDRKKLDPVEKGYIPAATGLVGAGGKDVFVFRAVGTGETTISLKYARAWEKEEKPADSAEFKVIIK